MKSMINPLDKLFEAEDAFNKKQFLAEIWGHKKITPRIKEEIKSLKIKKDGKLHRGYHGLKRAYDKRNESVFTRINLIEHIDLFSRHYLHLYPLTTKFILSTVKS